MAEMAHGIGFQGDATCLPRFTQMKQYAVGIEFTRPEMGGEHSIASLDDRRRSLKTPSGELRRHDPAVDGPAGMEPLGPGAVVQKGLEAGRLASAYAQDDWSGLPSTRPISFPAMTPAAKVPQIGVAW